MIPGLRKLPGGGNGNPLHYSCLENPHGQRSLADDNLWGHKEKGTTECLSTAQHKCCRQRASSRRRRHGQKGPEKEPGSLGYSLRSSKKAPHFRGTSCTKCKIRFELMAAEAPFLFCKSRGRTYEYSPGTGRDTRECFQETMRRSADLVIHPQIQEGALYKEMREIIGLSSLWYHPLVASEISPLRKAETNGGERQVVL